MARKKREEIKIEEIKAPTPPVSPLLSNVVAAFAHSDIVMLDFGFVAPNYSEPYNVEDTQVARICLPWDSAETLVKTLREAISDHKKAKRPQRKSK